jgi:pimeloyl-ACP methyl ester carboxylesterase
MENILSHRLYFNSADKNWVVFIHGIGGNSRTFCLQLKAFKEHFNILIPDLRGHGLSKDLPVPESGKYSLDLISEDIFRLMDTLGIAKANFVGCSFGASIIRIMEQSQPDRFMSIVMTGAVLRIKTSIFLIFKLGKWLAPYINNHFLYTIVAYFIMPYRNHRESRRLFIKASKGIDKNEYRCWLGILEEVKHRLDRLFQEPFFSESVLMVSGNEDHAFLNDCVLFNRRYSRAKIVILPNCGHLSSIEKYDEFNHIALKFIQKEKFANG